MMNDIIRLRHICIYVTQQRSHIGCDYWNITLIAWMKSRRPVDVALIGVKETTFDRVAGTPDQFPFGGVHS
jgi:hypothetical protein